MIRQDESFLKEAKKSHQLSAVSGQQKALKMLKAREKLTSALFL